jgi:manganese transport protein
MNAARTSPPELLPRSRRNWLALVGPAVLVSVGYMDPGNWATDLEGGARFAYRLVWVLVACNAMALLLQTASARLGIVTGEDLASACRRHYSPALNLTLWVLAELAIVACDMAEIVGSAVALNLLFGLPLLPGALLTALDVFVILALQRRGVQRVEAIVLVLVTTIAVCLLAELFLSRPDFGAVARGLEPHIDGKSLYVAIGILGATVMPHNLYLQSGLEKQRARAASEDECRRRIRDSTVVTTCALHGALFLNAAILMVAAAVFAPRKLVVSDLREAHELLTPLLGTHWAAALFAVALLCSGQSATITGTLAGQMVMEGFLRLRVRPFARRLLTRGLAIIPAVTVLGWSGQDGTMGLLIASQVVLGLQLPFAIVPLIRFTSSSVIMGRFVISPVCRVLAVGSAALIIVANGALLTRLAADLLPQAKVVACLLIALICAALGLLGVLVITPLRDGRAADTPAGSLRLAKNTE